MKLPSGKTVDKVIIAIFILIILWGLLFPTVTGPGEFSEVFQARSDAFQLAIACVGFETEYGYFPGTGRQVVGGDLLAALMGSNNTINPSKIVFMEFSPYKRGKGGISNGTFLDPWGGPYQIAFATGTNNLVLAGTNNIEVKKRVAVWNEPTLGTEPPWWQWERKIKRERRGVTSWD